MQKDSFAQLSQPHPEIIYFCAAVSTISINH